MRPTSDSDFFRIHFSDFASCDQEIILLPHWHKHLEHFYMLHLDKRSFFWKWAVSTSFSFLGTLFQLLFSLPIASFFRNPFTIHEKLLSLWNIKISRIESPSYFWNKLQTRKYLLVCLGMDIGIIFNDLVLINWNKRCPLH